MDMVSILTTYLAAPSGLPLPAAAGMLAARAYALTGPADILSAHLEQRTPIRRVWETAMTLFTAAASV